MALHTAYLSFVSADPSCLQRNDSGSHEASCPKNPLRAGSKNAEASDDAASNGAYFSGMPLFLANAAKLPAQAAGASKRLGTLMPRLEHSHSIERTRSLGRRVTFVE